jgi:hypothetical protein
MSFERRLSDFSCKIFRLSRASQKPRGVPLQDLKDHGVEVLWRPLHEMNQAAGAEGPRSIARHKSTIPW